MGIDHTLCVATSCAVLILSGCTTQPAGEPIITQYPAIPNTVVVVWVDDDKLCRKVLHRPGACAEVDFTIPGKCVIHSPKPKDWSDEWVLSGLGHELIHCFYGEGHIGLNAR
jgi:Ni,Fe-hydrogenase III small subunit